MEKSDAEIVKNKDDITKFSKALSVIDIKLEDETPEKGILAANLGIVR